MVPVHGLEGAVKDEAGASRNKGTGTHRSRASGLWRRGELKTEGSAGCSSEDACAENTPSAARGSQAFGDCCSVAGHFRSGRLGECNAHACLRLRERSWGSFCQPSPMWDRNPSMKDTQSHAGRSRGGPSRVRPLHLPPTTGRARASAGLTP